MLRIIAGKWRHRKIEFIEAPGLRPSLDRIRETLFNWLQPHIIEATCLDLFAGSGILGLEALSRGASEVVFVDQSVEVIEMITLQAQKLRAQDFQTSCLQIPQEADELPKKNYDIIFLDPPYENAHALPEILESLIQHGYVNEKTLFYVEMGKDSEFEFSNQIDILKYKKTKHIQYGLVMLKNNAA
ncbi:MAG: 16S rRNA (guanine(966)-N(2))-methyltransferase RsmD [Gammaproteobacteria bacterium]